MVRRELPGGSEFWWIILCICTLGGCYFLKLVIMKAIIDAQEK